ncbi:NYN domain-containing protein [Candidatus Palauibacter sp.]|uniref:NYN domain-containing protein n=1 Tax=Candidatus Palauibacter sp. TaxID=3101350 RepID=UPI003B011FA6
MTTRLAILIDGEFLRRDIESRRDEPAAAHDIIRHVHEIIDHLASKGITAPLYRVFYYTADPPSGKRINPMNKTDTPLAHPSVGGKTKQLHRDLEQEPYVAVRRGDVAFQGWRIKRSVARSLMEGKPRPLMADDIRPNLKQKGVDMRIGLDIASLALKRLVGHVVVVAADADMVPALKLARREGATSLSRQAFESGGRGTPHPFRLRLSSPQSVLSL